MNVDLRDQVQAQLLTLLARQGRNVPIPVAASAGVIAAMAGQTQALPVVLAWLLLVLLALAARALVLTRLPRLTSVLLDRRMVWAQATSAGVGLTLALSLVFMPHFDAEERMMQTLLLLGICAGAVAVMYGHPRLLGLLIAPIIGGEALWWSLGSGLGEHWMGWAVAGLILAFGALLMIMGRDSHRAFVESINLRSREAQSNQLLRSALLQAEQAMQAKTRFLASTSHDLRQPMHTLSLYAAALQRRPLDPLTAELCRNLNLSVQTLSAQMDALLDISKLDARVVTVHPERFRLAVWLAQIKREMLPAAHVKGLTLNHFCPHDAFVETDPLLLTRVVRNLVDNALKYTERGMVQLTVARDGELWRLAVRDTGCGIPLAEQGQVFEEFYQVGNRERDRGKGLGLGLSIVGRLVDLLDISLSLESSPGVGSCFSLGLAAAEAPVEPAKVPPAISGGDLDRTRVLVLDDDPAVREAMAALLRSHGADVVCAGSTREALVRLLEVSPDIVLSDLRLRDNEDGISAINALRGALPKLPAVLITGDTSPERLRAAQTAGLILLHKPVQENPLLQAMRAARGMEVER